MRVLIIENEIYLAQSIAAKLTELGNTCDVVTTTNDALKNKNYDVVLLSTSITGQDFYPIIEAYKQVVLILMVSYVSSDTVSLPLEAGAKDYILKPFMIEELTRKIFHHQEYEQMKRLKRSYDSYVTHSLKSVLHEADTHLDLPLLIATNYQRHADAYAYERARKMGKTLLFFTFADEDTPDVIRAVSENNLIYAVDFHLLKPAERQTFIDEIAYDKSIIICTSGLLDTDYGIKSLELTSQNSVFNQGDILQIEDYVKYIVLNYQHKYPDTELSKKLGISRKSLWEKRKKYGIARKK